MTTALTQRQHEVMFFAARGLNADEIGKRLGIAGRTVEIHRAVAVRKLGARNIAHAAVLFDWLAPQLPVAGLDGLIDNTNHHGVPA
jgi:DNA-binding CsgD family transcriptional regulator